MNKTTVKVRVVAYEFTCPVCNETQELGANEYSEGQPVQCKVCATEFEYSELEYV